MINTTRKSYSFVTLQHLHPQTYNLGVFVQCRHLRLGSVFSSYTDLERCWTGERDNEDGLKLQAFYKITAEATALLLIIHLFGACLQPCFESIEVQM